MNCGFSWGISDNSSVSIIIPVRLPVQLSSNDRAFLHVDA